MMSDRARTIKYAGEEWVNVNDLRYALRDDDLILRAGAMLKVCVKKRDGALKALRMTIAHFFTEMIGAFDHENN